MQVLQASALAAVVECFNLSLLWSHIEPLLLRGANQQTCSPNSPPFARLREQMKQLEQKVEGEGRRAADGLSEAADSHLRCLALIWVCHLFWGTFFCGLNRNQKEAAILGATTFTGVLTRLTNSQNGELVSK